MVMTVSSVLEFVFCLVDVILLYKFASLFLEKKDKNNLFLTMIVITIGIYAVSVFESMSTISMSINFVLVIVFTFAVFKSNYKSKLLIAILFYVLVGIYTVVTMMIWQTVTGTVVAISNEAVQLTSRYLFILITKTWLLFILYLITLKRKKILLVNILEFKITTFILALSLFIIFILAEIIIYQEITISYVQWIMVLAFFTVLISLLITQKYYKAKMDVMNLNLEKRMMEEHNQKLLQEIEADKQIYRLKHDMNNLFIVGKELLYEKKYAQLEEYFNKVIAVGIKDNKINTSDPTINAIINNKMGLNEEINFVVKTEIETCSFDAVDVAILLGNALDNALEASRNSKQKIVRVYINETADNLLIHIKNSYNGKCTYKDGCLLSSKRKRLAKGLGISNMEKVVMKYDGKMKFHYDDEFFEISIIINR